MIEDHVPCNADLCSNNRIEKIHEGVDDHSTLGVVEDDDSFLANSSLCKQHRSTIQMLDSLRKEVVDMVRNDDVYVTPDKSPQDVMIDLSSSTDLSSPLGSPLISRNITPISSNYTSFPSLNKHRITPTSSDGGHLRNCDDSTFCSMDHSINNEMNILKEVAKEFERELKAENLNTVFEAIERIGNSDDATISGVLDSGDKDIIRESIRNELLKNRQSKKPTLLESRILDKIRFFRSIECSSTNAIILIASIILYNIHRYISSRQE